MPVTPNSPMIGKTCEVCGGPATHYYGYATICCDCHTGEPGGGLYTREQADRIHEGLDPFPEPTDRDCGAEGDGPREEPW
jgi:hypothetical protein